MVNEQNSDTSADHSPSKSGEPDGLEPFDLISGWQGRPPNYCERVWLRVECLISACRKIVDRRH